MTRLVLLTLALPLALAAAEPPAPAAPAATASTHVMYDADGLKWGPAPPALPPGAQAAVLAGDPGTPGLFVLRLKAPAGYRVPRHWHPSDEHVTLIDGDLTLAMGEGSAAHSHTFAAGGFALLPARMPHGASTTGGAVIQITGTGPFEIHYLDPKDDPRPHAAP